ncbi:MAG: hypothetical protein JW864_15595 [Spirochaetes bacterium]|nr:hypothetical protein [Spirochaetota bacterium]
MIKKGFMTFSLMLLVVTAVFPFGEVKVEKAGKKIALRMMVNLGSVKKITLAVVPFNHTDGTYSQLGSFLASDTISGLRAVCPGNIKIAERVQIAKIMRELEFNSSGLVSSDSAAKAGNLTGVDALIIGEITEVDDYIKVNARLVDVSNGGVKSHADVKIAKDNTALSLMSKKIMLKTGNGNSRPENHSDNSGNVDWDGNTILIKKYDGFELKLVKIEKRTDSIFFNFFITNNKSNDRKFTFYRGNFKLIDYSGHEYTSTWVNIGDSKSSKDDGSRTGAGYVGTTLYSGVPVKSKIRFFDFPENRNPRLLIISFSNGDIVKISGFPSD